MSRNTTLDLERKSSHHRVSVPVPDEILHEIDNRANRLRVSRSTLLSRLLRLGLEAEQQQRDQLAQKIRRYRECADPIEAERLGDELGEMIFGQ